jgi:HEAT repeat protein
VPTRSTARREPSVAPRISDHTHGKSLAVLRLAFDKDTAYDARLIALDAIGQAKLVTLVPLVERSLGDPEHDVRLAAIEALGKLRHPRALSLLESVRDDMSEALELRVLAAALLLTPPQ